MTQLTDYYTRAQAAERLGVSKERVRIIAARDKWETYKVGQALLSPRADVERSAVLMDAQKAWRALRIPPRLWGAWWLSDLDEIETLPCPECGAGAYSPAGDHPRYSHRAACSACGWIGDV